MATSENSLKSWSPAGWLLDDDDDDDGPVLANRQLAVPTVHGFSLFFFHFTRQT